MNPEPWVGEYRIKRQIHGRGAYAHVRVEVRSADPGAAGRVVWAVDPGDRRSAQPAHDPDEVGAALDGAECALRDLDRLGVDTGGRAVHVTLAGILVVDTEPTAVRAAAAAATVAAFGAADRFALSYADGWRCQPTAAESAVPTMSQKRAAGDGWIRVAHAPTRDEAVRQFVAWKDRNGAALGDDDVRVNWGRHADGGDYWDVLCRIGRPTDSGPDVVGPSTGSECDGADE